MFFALPNLVSSAVVPCEPWTFTANIPEAVRGKEGKKLRDKWINNPNTQHQVYSAFEGVNEGLRISEPRNGEEGNPPLKLHAFVADIDAAVSEDELAAGIARLGELVPNYYERTLSGNARLIWLFEKSISFPNRRFAVEFMKLACVRVKVEAVAAGFDRPAWEEPNRYYTNSGEWKVISAGTRLSFAMLNGWVVEVAEKHVWKKDRGAIDIPLPIVWIALQKKFPIESAQWTGDFVEGAQGPTFFVDGASSPKSAIVKPTGMFTFSSHAIKPFYDWKDLLGAAFVEKYVAEQLGKAVEGIFHDGATYYRKDGYGDWKGFAKEDVASHLSVDRGLSKRGMDGTASETDRAIQFIQNWQGIVGAAPFVFQPNGLIEKNGLKFLNTHTRKVLQPAPGPAVWGPTGKFPIVSAFFDGIFSARSKPANPKIYFLAWFSRFFKSGYYQLPESGHSFLLFGPTGIGKTFLNQGLIPYLMGGGAEAQSYLLGESDFNSQLFQVPFWTVDDNSASNDPMSLRRYSTMMKKMAANTCFQYHQKFRVPCEVQWLGRVGITGNADEESLQMMPDLSISILDKLMIFLASDTAPIVFPDRRGCEKILRDEGPHFARWLLDFEVPLELVGDSRFGIKPYHEESLLQRADQSSRTSGFLEVLEQWRAKYFEDCPTAKVWEGTALRLLMELHKDELLREAALRGMTVTTVGMRLSGLKSKDVPWLDSRTGTIGRIWTISRPEKPASKLDALPVGTKFQK